MIGRYAAALVSCAVRFDGERLLVRRTDFPVGRLMLLAAIGALHFVDADAAAPPARPDPPARARRISARRKHLHARNAAHHGDALRQQRLGVFVHRVERQRVGSQRQVQHRLLGRIHLLIRRRPRHVGGQQAAGGLEMAAWMSCAAASILRLRLNCTVICVLPLRVRRAHRLDAGDGGKFAFERRGHRRCHGLRTGAGQRRGHLNGRVIHARQRRHRQRAEAHDRRTAGWRT